MTMDLRPNQATRHRTPRQLERKRELDKQTQRIKRETDKDRLIQIQADIQTIQRQMESLQKSMMMILNGQNTLRDTHLGSHPPQPSVSLPLDMLTPPDGRTTGTRGGSSSSSSGLTLTPVHGGQAPPKLYRETDRSILAADCSVASRELNHPPVTTGNLHENMHNCGSYSPHSVQSFPSPALLHPLETGTNQTTLDARRQPRELSNRDPISINGSKALITVHENTDAPSPTPLKYRGVALPFCLCQPKVHSSYADCFEHTIYDALIKAHIQPRAPPVPRSPPLHDLLLMGEGDNVVSRILIKMLKRDGFCGVDVMWGGYILLYRVLRYRLSPSLETLRDVPEWLRPTEIQNNTPHEIFSDFMIFPQLRNAMVSGSVDYVREEFDIDWGRSISVNWPSWKPLLVKNDSLEVIINPDFEPHVLNYDNWSLNPEFALRYPHMSSMVIIR